MVIYFIRHTCPDISSGICYGQSDLDLKATFPSEADAVIQKLKNKGVLFQGMVYSSPLGRCFQLAQRVVGEGVEIRTDPRLMEMNFGEWELCAWDAIDPVALRRWGDDFVRQACPKGESYLDLYQRVYSWFVELRRLRIPELVVFTHAGVIRSALVYLGETTLEKSFEIKVEYGDVFRREWIPSEI